MSFQLSILKILAGQLGGRASLELIKQHLAIFYTSGPEWPARMKRIASRDPNLDIFGQLADRAGGRILDHHCTRTKDPREAGGP